jgi:hypothetical protein
MSFQPGRCHNLLGFLGACPACREPGKERGVDRGGAVSFQPLSRAVIRFVGAAWFPFLSRAAPLTYGGPNVRCESLPSRCVATDG